MPQPTGPDACTRCGSPTPAKPDKGPRATYCSRACKSAASYERRRVEIQARKREASRLRLLAVLKVCPECAAEFTPAKTVKQVFCTAKCNSDAHRDSLDRICAEGDCDRPVRAKGLCAKHYRAQHPNARNWKKNGNPEVRRATLRRKTQLRRARLTDPTAEPIDRDAIGERDGWRCGLCLKAVDNALPYPHPDSPSLDHIEPLSLGGRHAAANVQISHLSCNVSKGNRVKDVQPLLIG